MRAVILILLLCIGCRKAEFPVIDTKGFEPIIANQIGSAQTNVLANPRSGDAWGKLAMLLHAYELHEQADACYHRAAALDRKNARWGRLHDALESGIAPAEITELRIGFKAWSDEAQQLLANGRHTFAAPLIDRLVKTYPDAPESWLLLGRSRLEQNDCAGAEQPLRQLLQISPDLVNAHWQLGVALICLRRYAEAVPILTRAVELKPDFGEAHFNLGFALARSGNGHAAIPSFHNAIRYNPDMIDPYITLADLLAQTGETQQATNLLSRALQLDPSDDRAKALLRRIQP
jgi:tetratricopeptide (TPR) repeat protein